MSVDLYEESVASCVDPHLRRTADSDGSPVVSEGVSSAGSQKTLDPSPAFQVDDEGLYLCNVCNKTLRSKKGIKSHTFLHNIAGVYNKKPSESEILECVPSSIEKICDEILLEPEIPNAKKKLVEDFKTKALKSPHWLALQKRICDPIIKSVLSRKKVLPSNQCEEDLIAVNKLLNDSKYMSDLGDRVQFLCSADETTTMYISHVLFRILTRLCEEIQIFVLKSIKCTTYQSTECPEEFASAEEILAFEEDMGNLFRIYYKKANSLLTPVWVARSFCMRRSFVEGKDEAVVSSSTILQKSSWEDKTIQLSGTATSLFKELELVLRSIINQTTTLTTDNVLDMLINIPNTSLLNKWHSLTTGFLSESDSLLFLKDIYLLIVNFSLKMHEKWLNTQEHEKRILQKFGIREKLKK